MYCICPSISPVCINLLQQTWNKLSLAFSSAVESWAVNVHRGCCRWVLNLWSLWEKCTCWLLVLLQVLVGSLTTIFSIYFISLSKNLLGTPGSDGFLLKFCSYQWQFFSIMNCINIQNFWNGAVIFTIGVLRNLWRTLHLPIVKLYNILLKWKLFIDYVVIKPADNFCLA